MSEPNPQLIAALVAARAAIDNLLLALTAQQEGDAPAPVSATAAAACKHTNRKSLATFGVQEAWECADCGYQYRR